jgi:hypothetical protein
VIRPQVDSKRDAACIPLYALCATTLGGLVPPPTTYIPYEIKGSDGELKWHATHYFIGGESGSEWLATLALVDKGLYGKSNTMTGGGFITESMPR